MLDNKIALIGDPWVGSVRRAKTFIQESPLNIDFTFVNMVEECNLELELPGNIRVIGKSEYNKCDFDNVLVMNDKHFQYAIDFYNPTLPNMVDKHVLADKSAEFGFGNFNDLTDKVFIKPRLGAGQYSSNDFCYKIFSNDDIPLDAYNPDIVIHRYVDCEVIISVTLVCDGNTIEFIDVTEANHLKDANEKNINTHLISKIEHSEQYQEFIGNAINFIKYIQYDKIPGVYMLQFMQDASGVYLNDFNIRSGPVADYMTELGYVHRIHRMIPYMFCGSQFKDCNIPHLVYQCYLKDKITKQAPSKRVVDRPAILSTHISDNKTSGLIRNDYISILEIFNEYLTAK